MTEFHLHSSGSTTATGFARWRKPISRILAVAFVALLVLTVSPHSPVLDLVTEIMGILLIIAAVLGRVWCALYIAGRKNSELCADGPYSMCRNPLYLFSFLGVVGFAFVAGSLPVGLAMIPIFWGYHHFVIRAEESRLGSTFGGLYADYCATVPRVVPNPNLYWSRHRLTIEPHVILRALSEVAWFLIALAGFEVIEHLRGASLGAVSLPTVYTWPF